MEGVATSMSTNAESVKTSVAISREIADRQKLVTELTSRAYLSVLFSAMVPQNLQTRVRYEPRMTILNNGQTPAYNVNFRIAADVMPFPLRPGFEFPLPPATNNINSLGPHLTKIISAVVPRLYAPLEVQQITDGVNQRIYVWGIVTYIDAFKIERSVEFCQSFAWLADGNVMSFDTTEHNRAD